MSCIPFTTIYCYLYYPRNFNENIGYILIFYENRYPSTITFEANYNFALCTIQLFCKLSHAWMGTWEKFWNALKNE